MKEGREAGQSLEESRKREEGVKEKEESMEERCTEEKQRNKTWSYR